MTDKPQMKVLKQIFRDYGYSVNKDEYPGLGNLALENMLKVFRKLLILKRQEKQFIGEQLSGSTELGHNVGQIQMLDELLEDLKS